MRVESIVVERSVTRFNRETKIQYYSSFRLKMYLLALNVQERIWSSACGFSVHPLGFRDSNMKKCQDNTYYNRLGLVDALPIEGSIQIYSKHKVFLRPASPNLDSGAV